jgi:phosphoglycolate phosphatase-like HAD superfamily hydrolase
MLASSGKADEAEDYQEIAGVGDATSTDDTEPSEPFPDIFQAAFGKLGLVESTEAMVVGDTPYETQAARQAALATERVLCVGFQEEALRAAGCVAVDHNPQRLSELTTPHLSH